MSQTYEVRLESQTDSQARIMSLEADSAEAARAAAEQKELDLVNFSLLPPEKDVWECPPGSTDDDPNGLVDLSRWDAYDPKFAKDAALGGYQGAVAMANRRLDLLADRIDVAPSGKVRGTSLSPRARERFLAHHQTEPYVVASIEEVSAVEVDLRRAMVLLARLKHDSVAWERTLDELRTLGVPMAAVTAALYGLPWQKQIDGSSVTVFSSATVKGTLHTGYTANYDTEDFFNDVSASEITGTGYTTGGVTFTSKTSNYNTTTDAIWLDAADLSWTTSTLSATDLVIQVDTAGATSTDPLWGNVDFGATVTTTAGTFAVTFDATGVILFDVT